MQTGHDNLFEIWVSNDYGINPSSRLNEIDHNIKTVGEYL